MEYDYLETHWTEKEIKNFVQKVHNLINNIGSEVIKHQYSASTNVYKAKITKHNYLYYRIIDNQLELLLFWDTRQDPEKLIL